MAPITKSDILSLSLTLSLSDRIELVQDIWDSVAEHPEAVEVTEEQMAEIERRVADLERNPDSAISWEEVQRRLRSRHGL